MDDRDTKAAAQIGYTDASRLVATQYAAGASLEQIQEHHTDTAITLLNDAKTPSGRAYALAYAETAEASIADLRSQAETRGHAGSHLAPPRAAGSRAGAESAGAASHRGPSLRSNELTAWENGPPVTGAAQLAHLVQTQRTGQPALDREAG